MNSILIAFLLIGAGGNAGTTPTIADTLRVQLGPTVTSMRVGLDVATLTTPMGPREILAGVVPTERKTRWVEGGVIGAVVGGVGLLLLRNAAENHREVLGPEPRFMAPLAGAAAGFVIGALVGHRIER